MKSRRTPLLYCVALTCLLMTSGVRAADCRINMALSANGGVASQRDNPFGLPPENGNDGAIAVDANFAHTGNADNEWWEVNIGAPRSIAEVRVWLRSDAIYATRDSNLRLVIYNDAAHTSVVYSSDLPDGTSIPLPYRNFSHVLPSAVTGQVVRIEHPPGVADYLQINEVQVFGQAVEEVNLALAGLADQSSTYGMYGPQRANDGVVSGVTGGGGTGSTAHTGGTEDPLLPWWQVDLGAMQTINAIRVFTSADTDQARNDDLSVMVLDETSALMSSNYNAIHPSTVVLPGHDFPANKQYVLYTFEPPVTGRIVKVAHTQTNAQYLVLPEVEVFKAYTNPPTIHISQGPTTRTVDLNSSVNLSVAACVSGANMNYLSYQWQSNGVDIVGANGSTYTTPLLTALGDHTFGVKVLLPGYSVTTQAVITVYSDLVPPTVVSNSFAARSSLKMTLNFSEALDPVTATNAASYVFAGGPKVSNPVLAANGKDVSFVVEGLATCDDYALTISGVKDLAGNTIVATNLTGSTPAYEIDWAMDGTATESSDPFGYAASGAIDGNTGSLMHTGNADNEWWEVDLGSPKAIGQLALWFRRDCCGDRDGNLLITVMDSSRNPVWTGAIGDPLPLTLNPRSTNFLMAPGLMGQIVRVEHPVGVANYLDFAEVQVIPPSIGFCITQSPTDTAVVTNTAANFTVVLKGAGPFTFQWQHNGSDILGATNATLHISAAGPAQEGSYTVVVSNLYRTHTSAAGRLSLVPPAVVQTLLKINFNGTLAGTAYTLAPGEVDVTRTFAAMAGTEVISNGFAILNSANPGEGFSVTNNIVDAGSGVATSFLGEIVFIPAAGFEQGTGQDSSYADIFSFGSTWWSDVNHVDGVFALRYTSPTNYQLRVDSVASSGTLDGTALPLPGTSNHIAIVYRQGPGMTNNLLDYYLNGELISTMPLAKNVGSSSVGSVFATFGQAVPGATSSPRGLDGLVESIAYSTFSGVFSPRDNFVLFQAPVAPRLGITGPSNGQVTLTWDGPSYHVQENADLGNPAGWTDLPGGGSSPVNVPIGPGSRFYRLWK